MKYAKIILCILIAYLAYHSNTHAGIKKERAKGLSMVPLAPKELRAAIIKLNHCRKKIGINKINQNISPGRKIAIEYLLDQCLEIRKHIANKQLQSKKHNAFYPLLFLIVLLVIMMLLAVSAILHIINKEEIKG